jgi:hypothetical protein
MQCAYIVFHFSGTKLVVILLLQNPNLALITAAYFGILCLNVCGNNADKQEGD